MFLGNSVRSQISSLVTRNKALTPSIFMRLDMKLYHRLIRVMIFARDRLLNEDSSKLDSSVTSDS